MPAASHSKPRRKEETSTARYLVCMFYPLQYIGDHASWTDIGSSFLTGLVFAHVWRQKSRRGFGWGNAFHSTPDHLRQSHLGHLGHFGISLIGPVCCVSAKPKQPMMWSPKTMLALKQSSAVKQPCERYFQKVPKAYICLHSKFVARSSFRGEVNKELLIWKLLLDCYSECLKSLKQFWGKPMPTCFERNGISSALEKFMSLTLRFAEKRKTLSHPKASAEFDKIRLKGSLVAFFEFLQPKS